MQNTNGPKCFIHSNDEETHKLQKLEVGEACCVSVPFQASKPGKYKIQATFSYHEGEPVIKETEITVESKIEAELNIGVIMLAYTLTRLSLNFTLSQSNSV